jgi:hypothetical protein
MGVWDDDGSIYTFKPERWIDWEDGKMVYNARKGWNMQFGAGPRGCFGKQAAVRFIQFNSSNFTHVANIVDA